jgi:hypothetical protein
MISATDSISGISTTDSGADAVFRVKQTISFLVVTSNLRYSSRFPGESQRFTATGYYSDGTTTNSHPEMRLGVERSEHRGRPERAG